jgi:acyl carrier protein
MSDNGNNVKDILKDFICKNFLFTSDAVNIEDDTSFLESGIVDSTGILELIDFLEEKFEIQIENREVIPENLDSLNNIERFISTKMN